MTKKNTGLAAFTRAVPASKSDKEAPLAENPLSAPVERQRGKGSVVALTVRLPRAEWERVHQLALAEGISIQKLALRGLSKVFAEKGLPGLKE